MKHWAQLRAILLSGLGSWGAGVIICGLLGIPGAAMFGILGLLGGTTGAMAPRWKDARHWGSLVLGVVLSIGLGIWWFRDVLVVIFGTIVCLLAQGALTVSGYGFYPPLGIWTLVLLALATPGAGTLGVQLQGTVGMLLALGLTLDGLRDQSLRKSQLQDRAAAAKAPVSMVGGSYRLLGIFLVAALGVGFMTLGLAAPLVERMGQVASGSARGIFKLFYYLVWLITAIVQWFSDLFPDLEDDGPGSGWGLTQKEGDIYLGGAGSWLSTILLVALMVALAVGICAAALYLMLRHRRKTEQGQEHMDYEDLEERLPRKRHLRLRPFRSERPPQNGILQVRYSFQQLLRRKLRRDGSAITKTPNELLDVRVSEEAALIRAYNRVRYGGATPTAAELQAAQAYLKRNKK